MSEFVIPRWDIQSFIADNELFQNALKEGRGFVAVADLCWSDWEHTGLLITEPAKGTILNLGHVRNYMDDLTEFLSAEPVVREETAEEFEKTMLEGMEFDRQCLRQGDNDYVGYRWEDDVSAIPDKWEPKWSHYMALKALTVPVKPGEVKVIPGTYQQWLRRHGW